VAEVTEALEDFDPTRAGRRLTEFVDDLSNWYVRRSRRRFWDGDPAALATLAECLDVVTRLLAPFVPFVTEEVHERLVCDVDPSAATSVHLESWPQAEPAAVDTVLAEQMASVRRVVELGRSARAESAVRTRQPLARALVSTPGWDGLPGELVAHVADELNVRQVEPLATAGDLVDVSVKANFRALGKRFGKRTPTVADAIHAADHGALVTALRDEGAATVVVEGEPVAITADDIISSETPRTGWAVASAGSDTVALDLQLDDELRAAGIVRELVRSVQDARKSTGLEVTDRIELWWSAPEPAASAVRSGAGLLGQEVLAVTVTEGEPAAPLAEHALADPAVRFWLREAGT
jgi:isoleucyl-tRNA synthetase